MTNQYRKFLAGSVSAAIAASTIVSGASAASFKDVAANSAHADAIHTLTADGVLKGLENGAFGVEKPVTRGQVAKIFARLLEGNQPDDLAAFSDIPVDHVDQELVKAAAKVKAIGAFTGSNGNLMPFNHLTRQQMAKILVEAFNLQHNGSYTDDLKDIHTASTEFQDPIAILAENGITQVADGKFRPLEPVTRAQFATFVQRARQAASQAIEQPADSTELAVQDVQFLSAGGRHLEITFNKSVPELANTQFRVIKKDSQAVMGTEEVRLNKDGDTGFVYAYTWDEEPILVKKVDGNVVYGLDGEKLDLGSYVILKDGKPMRVSDLQAGDMLYFNKDAKNVNGKSGIAEVYNHTVTGKLTQVFDGDAFEVNDTIYDCIGDVFAARILNGDEFEDFREGEAERLEGKEVTLYFSRNSDLVLVERGNKTKPIDTTKPAFTSSNITSIGAPDNVLSAAETLTLNFSETLSSAAVETIQTKLTAAFNQGVTVSTDDHKKFAVKVNEDVIFGADTVKVTFNESELKDLAGNGNEAFDIIMQD